MKVVLVAALSAGLGMVPAPQKLPAPQQRYEVSSITVCPPVTVSQTGDSEFRVGAVRPVAMRIERTRVGLMCVNVDALIHMAYNGGRYGHRNAAGRDVQGGPDWIRTERYTIEGSADGVQNPDLLGAMLRTLLEEQFQLRVRRHEDNTPMYALKVARGGLKIKPLAPGDCAASGDVLSSLPQPPAAEMPVPCGTFRSSMNGAIRISDLVPATFRTLASQFDLDRHVIDKTGIKDRFAIHFEGETAGAPAAAVSKALEAQLGLTLVSTKDKRVWVQIEHIHRPG